MEENSKLIPACLACTALAFGAGYYLRGVAGSPSVAAAAASEPPAPPVATATAAAEDEDEETGSDSDDYDGEPLKLVLVVRTDIGMKKGKMMAQCCHAAVGAVQRCDDLTIARWESCGTAKIALKVKEKEVCFLFCRMIEDFTRSLSTPTPSCTTLPDDARD